MSSAAEILQTPESAAPLQTQATPQTTEQPAANGAWYDGVQDTELKGWLSNKKYESPEMAAKAAWSLERLLGADKAGRTVVLPKDDADVEGVKAFRAKLGVPESAEGYKLPLPEGVTDDTFAKTAAKWFHETGIPAKAAEGIVGKWNEFVATEMRAAEEAEKADSQAKLEALKSEWGHSFDERSELGRRGLRAIGEQAGLDDNDLKKLESSLGTDKMLKMFWKLGDATKEAGFAGGNGAGQFSTSKDAAQEQINEITAKRMSGEINDHQWRTEYDGPDGKMTKLMKIITG